MSQKKEEIFKRNLNFSAVARNSVSWKLLLTEKKQSEEEEQINH